MLSAFSPGCAKDISNMVPKPFITVLYLILALLYSPSLVKGTRHLLQEFGVNLGFFFPITLSHTMSPKLLT